MLIFKKNIYEKDNFSLYPAGKAAHFIPEYHQEFTPYHYIKAALGEEEGLFETLSRQLVEYQQEDTKKFFPSAHKIGSMCVIKTIVRILWKGLIGQKAWYYMNTYHFCVLYDVLYRFAYNYNLDSRVERLKALPELKGAPLPFDLFISDYFFNTVFLMDMDKYNSMTRKEKKRRKFSCPCQFGVINGLVPTREEMELQKAKDYPYTIYV